VANFGITTGPNVSLCNVANDGTLTACALSAASVRLPLQLGVSGATLYVVDGAVPWSNNHLLISSCPLARSAGGYDFAATTWFPSWTCADGNLHASVRIRGRLRGGGRPSNVGYWRRLPGLSPSPVIDSGVYSLQQYEA
jgi:hypothetical protein